MWYHTTYNDPYFAMESQVSLQCLYTVGMQKCIGLKQLYINCIFIILGGKYCIFLGQDLVFDFQLVLPSSSAHLEGRCKNIIKI